MPGIRCENLSKHFGNITALQHVFLSVEDGGFVALLGPSGSGKTTLLRILAGLEIPDSGTVWFDDALVSNEHIVVPSHKRDIGMVFQDLALWPHMTVSRHLEVVLKAHHVSRKDRNNRIDEVLSLMGLKDRSRAYPGQLSGGEKQRLALARALITYPRFLFLDEPLSNLDIELRRQLLDEICRVKETIKATVIYVTHSEWEAEQAADRVVSLERGHIAGTYFFSNCLSGKEPGFSNGNKIRLTEKRVSSCSREY